MKTSLDRLPEATQQRIREIGELVRGCGPVEMVVLFGSYARGDWVEDPEGPDGGYFSDFDLLAVVPAGEVGRTEEAWGRVVEQARAIAGPTSVSVIVHDIKQLNHEIRLGQYFFIDILREGVSLYDSRKFQLAAPKALERHELLELGLFNFRYWFGSANEFWLGAGYYAARGQGPQAAFLLHQAVERGYAAVNLVFTGYKPKSHKIDELANQAAPLHPALAGALPRADGEDERLFDLLRRAYIEARYSRSYRITAAELAELRARVRDFALRVREACQERLAQLCGPDAVGPLPEVPHPEDVDAIPEMPTDTTGAAFHAWKEGLVTRGFDRGKAQGKAEGLIEGQLRALLAILAARSLVVDDATRARLAACRDPETLVKWITAAATAASAEDLFRAR